VPLCVFLCVWFKRWYVPRRVNFKDYKAFGQQKMKNRTIENSMKGFDDDVILFDLWNS
jgi:hypothetical protein